MSLQSSSIDSLVPRDVRITSIQVSLGDLMVLMFKIWVAGLFLAFLTFIAWLIFAGMFSAIAEGVRMR